MAATPTLRLTQTASQDNRHIIELEWLGVGARQTAMATVDLALTEQDQRDIRWYIEEYAEYPFEPNPQRAARIEARMRTLGHELFNTLFASNTRTLRLWAKVAEHLDNLRVEIVTDAEGATALPWELLRDPDTDTTLALHARSFVRAAPEVPRQALTLEPQPIIRILLVICRPAGGDDVPFRSVASRLIKGLRAEAHEFFQLDVLRPPTFARLGQVLREAKAVGKPYHVVHFDGHGVYSEPNVLPVNISPSKYRIAGPQGFLLFESDTTDDWRELIHGSQLGDLLVQSDVPLLVLNACRSAHAAQPDHEDTAGEAGVDAQLAVDKDDPYAKVRAFGSLAQQVMLSGVGGVVAMRYNVYVVTAAQFVAELYRALVQGSSLGEAVTRGRKHLHEQPVREIVQKLTLQDWLVPVVYEAQAMSVFSPSRADLSQAFSIKPINATPKRGDLDQGLPAEPDVGFFGRDETLLALDRGFDRHHVVLLHAYAGSGKTATAVEFARWYALTGGVEGPVLFSSFAQRTTLIQLLDQLGHLFHPLLQQSGIQWNAITDIGQKRNLALQVLKQVPVLWVWDNVEPVAGFPAGTPSAWTADEQRELANFLRDTRGTKARFILTSRRDEHAWLGDLPLRVTLPRMPMHERWQLAEALAARYGVTLPQRDWRPLILYSQGNPMTLTVVVRQALRDGLRTAAQVQGYVQKLGAGEAIFDDDVSEGRSKSLGASLSYGFEVAFSEQERAVLALLYHFQGFVAADALRMIGDSRADWHIPAIAGLSYQASVALLNQATEVGLLTALGGGYYTIHPALPWFFRRLYEEYYGVSPSEATHAYAQIMGELGSYCHDQYGAGNRDLIGLLRAEEANLLHARQLAMQQGWYHCVIGVMQGLHMLYEHMGRRAAWRALVQEIVPAFVDLASNGPLPGKEIQDGFRIVMQYQVLLLKEERQWDEAARLQEVSVSYDRQQAKFLLSFLPEQLDSDQRYTLRSLATSLHLLGNIQYEQGSASCVLSYQESYDLSLQINDYPGATASAFHLGNAYLGVKVSSLHDLAQADQWYRQALELIPENDRLGKGRVLAQLGMVEHERFEEARGRGQPEIVLLEYLNAALRTCQEALRVTPPDAVNETTTIYNQLGLIYRKAGQTEKAVHYYQGAIRYREQAGAANRYEVAEILENIAITYAHAKNFNDALLFAQAALHNYEQCGSVAATNVAEMQQLIIWIGEQNSQRQHL